MRLQVNNHKKYLFLSTHMQMNSSSIKKVFYYINYFSKNLDSVASTTMCSKSEVTLVHRYAAQLPGRVFSRQGNLADLKLKSGLFKHISGPRLGTKLIMNKNGLLFTMCSSMTLRRPQTSLDSRYF